MNRKSKIAATVIAAVMAVNAQAGTIVCSGTIETLQFDATNTGGYLSIRLSSMNVPVYFCDPDNPWNGTGSGYSISAATCRTLYATFLAARISGQPVTNMYFDGSDVPASCDGWAAWKSANIRHYLL
jgi:hypothetical protein